MSRYHLLYKLLFPFICSIALVSCNRERVTDVKIVYYPGTDKIKQSITYLDSLKNGEAKEFFSDGILKSRRFYIRDTLSDTTFLYHPNGKLRALQMYKNKKAHGCWKEFNTEGKMYSEIFFKNGMFDSTCSVYSYRSIRLQTRINYKEGRKHGLEEQYYPNGNPKFKLLFRNGDPCKNVEEWTPSGKKVNNDFKISIAEGDDVLMKNTLTYYIRLQNPKPGDKVYQEVGPKEDDCDFGALFTIKEENGVFKLQFVIPKGGFIMQKITIVAFRKTDFGNTCSQSKSFNAASNNF